jgi:hypothetical protein
MDDTIKWKRTNTGNIMFALCKGKVKHHEAALTDDWQDRLEVFEWEDDVYDVIIVKPNMKEGHREFIFSPTPKWEGELTPEQWCELRSLTFDEISTKLQNGK